MKILKGIALSLIVLTSCHVSNKKTDMDIFVDGLMDKMTLQEKIGQLNLVTPGGGILTGSVVSTDVEQKIKDGQVGGIFGIYGPEKVRQAQSIAVNSRLGIPMLFGSDVIHGYKTTYPIPLGLASSWDTTLISQTATMAAKEATADGIFWNFSPMVDIAKDARWGRIAEGAGEDVYLGSQIAKAMVKGYQGNDLADPTTMMATVKHMALYGAAEAGRDYNTVDMSRVRMYNEYLPPYKAAIDAGVGCVMSAFNDVDGVPASGNKWLLTDLLRDEWGFNGFVVSDYTSVNEMIDHGMGDLQAVSAQCINAGLDMDMVGEGFLTTLEKSLNEGKVTEKSIDMACRRILEAKYKLGLFDDPFRYLDDSRPSTDILSEQNRDLARVAAQRSFVLLKNNNNTLPLKKNQKVALIGPFANDKSNMLGTWAPTGDVNLSVTILDGFINQLGSANNVRYAKGANVSDDSELAAKVNVFGTRIDIDKRSSKQMIQEAKSIAASSDVIVAIVGEASEMSGESSSRSDIVIPASQKLLIKELKKTGKPLVLLTMSGRPLALGEELEAADALMQIWNPGVEAGNAVADVLYGVYNPSGKLPVSFPRNVGQVPIYYSQKITGRPQEGEDFQKFKSNYLDVENSPLFPFGYGLSYTRFEYSNLKLSTNKLNFNNTIVATIDVTNRGKLDGEETVQLYIRDMVSSITPAIKELKGFSKVFIPSGETRSVKFNIAADDLRFYNAALEFVAERGDFEAQIGTNSNDVLIAPFTLE
ncbi:beta-glucosidase BglX [Saccharicrinis aurantiacus]|uniref:beta-glucosidase BglX n=1 Tax=Saccharicrinis aurantiacus TaxID=1849719 RepID=UPI002493466E|nr:beta-glucosidase BglX [Saccharicrinis aurantiacus]